LPDQASGLGGIGKIRLNNPDFLSQPGYLCTDSLRFFVGIGMVDDDIGAGTRTGKRELPPQAPRRARNQYNLSTQRLAHSY
jgi:hypothetical protein